MGYRRPGDADSATERVRSIKRVLWVILFLNIAVALAKLIWGTLAHSTAMQADGFHSMFDGTSNVIGLIGMAFASRPADREHPYGHEKFETYASAAIAGMLVFAAYRIGSGAILELRQQSAPPQIEIASFVVMISTLIVNIFITTWERRVGKKLGSSILVADASHTGSDILVSLGVIVSMVLVKMGFEKADPIVALLVSGVIVYTAWQVFKAASATLSDESRIPAESIGDVVMEAPGVLGYHHVRTRGPEAAVYVDLHVQVDASRTVSDGHRIAESVERLLVERFPQVVDAIVHLEPYDEYQVAKTAEEIHAVAR